MKKLTTLVIVGILSIPAFSAKFITIGTGGVTGVYYPTGGAICRMVNKMRKKTKIRCSVESTAGSIYNVNRIKMGELDFGIAQSDVVYQAYNGKGKFEGKPYKELRTIMTIYPELLTFVVRKDANIKSLYDMKDKVINIGNSGSGQRNTLDNLFAISKDLDIKMLKTAMELKATEMPLALKDKKIDGYFYMVGHPTANIKDAANYVDIDLVDISEESFKDFDKLLKTYPYYGVGVIPKGMYKGVNHDTKSFGVKATLITSASMDNKSVETIVKAILDNFDDFKKLHPAYSQITKESLLEGLGAPQHKAAEAYFKKVNILK